ncbi:SH3 domain-containing protein [Alkalicella caledoniensis]|uniref:SH3 domain-containing protein n=1 Tax=Alkalicella caledoniensis TaxID=2731377 RepID=A0A7G9W405_ALKCA|nr:SH3 domain-containing protein [Alkalicella caledoniensis]QNO13417.1 SH3 domain-containing protein [Alkalicella caledoniensis]
MNKVIKALLTVIMVLVLSRNVIASTNLSANELLAQGQAMEGTNPYQASQIYEQGHHLYPNDARFLEGVNRSLRTIFSWSQGSHRGERYSEALGGYNFILRSNLISSEFKAEVEKFKGYAESGRRLFTPAQLLTQGQAMEGTNPYQASQIYEQGHYLYPNDVRFLEGVNRSLRIIFSWSQGSHRGERYSEALGGYNFILRSNLISSEFKAEVEKFKGYAESGKKIVTQAELLAQGQALESSNPYQASQIYEQGHYLYPNDARFLEGVNRSLRTIFSWSQGSHRGERYSEALGGYNFILRSNLISSEFKAEVEKFKGYAESGKKIVTQAELLAQGQAMESSNPYQASQIYEQGHYLYPNDARFLEGVNRSLRTIFSWSQGSHRGERYSEALGGYNFILRSNLISSGFRAEVEKFKGYAESGRRLFTPAQLLTQGQAMESSNPYQASQIYEQGHYLYPNDARFLERVNRSLRTIFSWSQGSHRGERYSEALGGYNFILRSNLISSEFKAEVEKFKGYAESGKKIFTPAQLLLQGQTAETNNLYLALDIYQEGYYLYPADIRFIESIRNTAQKLLEHSQRNHNQGNFYQAITGYERILELTNVPNNLILNAKNGLAEAKKGIIVVNDNIYILYTEYNITFENALNTQMTRGPQTDLYSNNWENAKREDVSYYMNPDNFTIKDFSNIGEDLNSITINTPVLRVRSGPSTEFSILGQVLLGETYDIIEQADGWYKINFSGGIGWVSGQYVIANSGTIPVEMFQFLDLSSRAGINSSDLNRILLNRGILHNKEHAFIQAATQFNVNEIYLVAHALLETGNGASTLANGVLVTQVDGQAVEPRIVYNMFGIGAHDSAPIRLGSEYAYKQGWFTPEQSILGGAQWISTNYINHSTYKQNTLYKMRWNPATPGVHQYATDIGWAIKQTLRVNMKALYDQCSEYTLRFDIPKYK